MDYDVVIIGTGPSGLFAAANIKNKKVLIIEKNDEIGKKFLISGSGQCNLTHYEDIKQFITHYGERKNYVKKQLFRFTNDDTINYFQKYGMNFIIDKNGKYFPKTKKSKDILNILINVIKGNNYTIKTSEKVKSIKKEKDFIIKTNKSEYESKMVIIATGGKSYPNLGTNGDGYEFAKKFGHNIITPKPALTNIKIKNFDMQELSGTSFKNAKIKISDKKQNINDLLITHQGFSGPCILDFSRYLNENQKIKISFINLKNKELFKEDINKKIKKSNDNLFSILKEYELTKRFIDYIENKIKINPKQKSHNIDKRTKDKIIDFLIDHEYTIDELGNFDNAMVTNGGIDTKEINPKNMESKIIKNLYFAGEIIDVDGDTGGYNIQYAFSTAWVISEYLNSLN
jgi:hypothetical protein